MTSKESSDTEDIFSTRARKIRRNNLYNVDDIDDEINDIISLKDHILNLNESIQNIESDLSFKSLLNSFSSLQATSLKQYPKVLVDILNGGDLIKLTQLIQSLLGNDCHKVSISSFLL